MNKMLYNKYPKGSEWRRWDLHMHTPGTNKSDNFIGSNLEEKWYNFGQSLNEYVEEIAVVGITDYFSIDNYFRFKSEVTKGTITKQFDLILPNVELRISPVTGSSKPINIHCIFNPIIENELNDRFFSKLQMGYGKSTYSATKSDLIRFGKDYSGKPDLNDNDAYINGVRQFVIEFGKLKSLFISDQSLKENAVIIVSNKCTDGVSGLVKHSDLFEGDTSQLDATRRSIYQFSDAIFSSNPKDKDYFTGQGVDDAKTIIFKCKSLKPCFHGCDAHNNDKIFCPDDNRYCWIKSDPTFEGFKQVLYEPIYRVHIGEEKPDEKRLYYLIDKIKFQDSNFITDEIEINQNLVAIIGGKSTGKSILLKNIAKSVDQMEFKNRLKTANISDSKPITGMEIYWKDGQISKLDSENNPNKRIIYIPQSYLNRVVEDEKRNTDIDDIIKEILLQDETFEDWYSKLKIKEREISDTIEKLVKSLFDNIAVYYENNGELKKIGDEKGVLEQIKKISDEIKRIQGKLNFTQESIDSFNNQSDKIKKDKILIEAFEEDIKTLSQLKEAKVLINNDSLIFKSDPISHEIERYIDNKIQVYSDDWKDGISTLITKYTDKLNSLKSSLNLAIEAIKPLQENVNSQKSLTQKYSELEEEQKKQRQIFDLKYKIESSRNKIQEIINHLSTLTAEYYSIYLEAKDKVNFEGLDEELTFDIKTEFKDADFYNLFTRSFFDGRSISKEEFRHLTNPEFKSKESYKEFIKRVIRQTLNGNLPKKDNVSSKEVIVGLVKNWFIHNYKVEYQGDQLNDMSPGKKSFVLLRLLIDLDNSKCPILIDQPEDDLDNRSIYYQVVEFLRKRKSDRQIIIATHNPNLVLGADAEQIIVANQDGKDTKNLTSHFEYVSGGIEHSCPEDNSIKEILYKRGVQEHICDVLEGGEEAFNKRRNKYHFSK